MSFGPASLLETLGRLEQIAGPAKRYIIALSGGPDSTVLADTLCRSAGEHGKPLLAVHVDHGLQPESAAFATFCQGFCSERSLDLECLGVDVDRASGGGLEAAAREARYDALAALVGEGDWLISAHHRDDQAETLLLNLLRGSGPLGIAAMAPLRTLGAGWLVRPLLDVPRSELLQYAEQHAVASCMDSSNDDLRFDRNFLRRDILPRIADRWPGAARSLARSAALARDAAELLDALADIDLEPLLDASERCAIDGLRRLSASRQRNAIRRLARRRGIAPPAATHLAEIMASLVTAREDAAPEVSWPGGEARRFRNRLYLMPPLPAAAIDDFAWSGAEPLSLGPQLGTLSLETVEDEGLDAELVSAGLTVRPRRGGERIRLESHGPTRKLKKLLNERGILPWMRDRLPLLYSEDRLVAVADLWVAADARARPGCRVRWRERPVID